MKKIRILPLVVAGLFAASMFTGCGSKQTTTEKINAEPIKIGAIFPLTGKLEAFGKSSKDGFMLAVDKINANGGINGRKVEAVIKDDEATPDKAKTAFEELVSKDKIVALVGSVTSGCSIAISSLAQAKNIPMIATASTNDAVTDAGDYIFRACYNDSFQGEVVATFAIKTLKAKKAAIISDGKDAFNQGLEKSFREAFIKLGGEIVSSELYNTGDKNFDSQIEKVKSGSPEVVFLPDYYNVIPDLAKQLKAKGVNVPLLGADGWDQVDSLGGDEVVGCYYSNHYSDQSDDPDVKNYIKEFSAKYNAASRVLDVLAYDAANILFEAIERAGSTEPEKIKNAIKETNSKFITGKIKFNEKRNPVKSAVMVRLDKGSNGKLTTSYAGTVELQ